MSLLFVYAFSIKKMVFNAIFVRPSVPGGPAGLPPAGGFPLELIGNSLLNSPFKRVLGGYRF